MYRGVAPTISRRGLFSPQAWGCTAWLTSATIAASVFPTGVGVYRYASKYSFCRSCFPHRRGGVPEFDPQFEVLAIVFPTGVGVYRFRKKRGEYKWRFPHRRGGVPRLTTRLIARAVVFPTGVGVYRVPCQIPSIPIAFSPQAWGCTVVSQIGGRLWRAFSPQAWGCTVLMPIFYRVNFSFPHRRGGVPTSSRRN